MVDFSTFHTAAHFYHYAETALEARHQYHAAKHTRQILEAFKQAPSAQTAWNVGGNIVGVLGTDRVLGHLVKFGVKTALGAHKIDASAGAEMVELMKARVPVDTGNLLNGISYEDDDGEITVTASGIKESSGVDYARFVEFGTKPNSNAVADENFFADGSTAGAPVRRSKTRAHTGSPAQPFFWNSAREVLAKRGKALEDVVNRSAADEGLR